jgi:ABC-2 type transport system permease protein
MRSLLEQTMLGGGTLGVLAFGWNHPITLAILAAVAIALASRAVAGEIENGAIELVLAQPVSRAAYLGAHLIFGMAALTLVAAAGAFGTMIGQRVMSLDAFGPGRMVQLLCNAILLQMAIYAATLLVSSWGREAGRVAVIGVLIALVSYFINVIATLWPKASFLEPYSLHTYYDPRAILVRGELATLAVQVLAGVAAGTAAVAFWRFATRDLP